MKRPTLYAVALVLGIVRPWLAVESQVTIEALQGTSWSPSLTISTLESMRFRWKYTNLSPTTTASWQVTFTAPESAAFPPVVKSVNTSVPFAANQFATFDIAPAAMPADVPSKFYVRVRSSNGLSPWLPVTIAQRAGTSGTSGSVSGALSGTDTRTGSTSTRPIAPPAPPPLIIPGGGIEDTPLWIRMTRLGVAIPVDEGDGDDVYAIVATVALNATNPRASTVDVVATPIYENMKSGSFRSPGLVPWGIGGTPKPIRTQPDAIIVVAAMKHVSASVPIALAAIEGKLVNAVANFPATSMDYMARNELGWTVRQVVDDNIKSFLRNSGDIQMSFNGAHPIGFSQVEIDRAKAGDVIKRGLSFDSQTGTATQGHGSYYIRFQMGKLGVEPEPGG